MQPVDVLPLVTKVIAESKKNFLLNYLDENGFPHSSYMGFIHLNKNLSVLLTAKESSRKADDIKRHAGIELVFQSRDYKYIVKLFGKAIVAKSPNVFKKLAGAYPQMAAYYSPDGSDAVIVQLNTKVIEIEYLEEGQQWHSRKSYLIEENKLVEMDNPVVEGNVLPSGAVSTVEDGPAPAPKGDFDSVRRLITRNHGEMLVALVERNFDSFMKHVVKEFSSDDGMDFAGLKGMQAGIFTNMEMANAETNWGLRGFERNADGTVSCHYFLDIIPQKGEPASVKQKEVWMQIADDWCLLKIEKKSTSS